MYIAFAIHTQIHIFLEEFTILNYLNHYMFFQFTVFTNIWDSFLFSKMFLALQFTTGLNIIPEFIFITPGLLQQNILVVPLPRTYIYIREYIYMCIYTYI